VTLLALLIELRARHARLEQDADGLLVRAPRGALTPEIRLALTEHKEELLKLPRPHLNARGELVTPTLAPPQYHWMRMADILREVDAPPEVWRKYTSAPYPAKLNGRHRGKEGGHE
jgi:hypothetical protein